MAKHKPQPTDDVLEADAPDGDALDLAARATPDETGAPQPLRVKLGTQRFALKSLDDLTPGQLIILRLLMPQRNAPLVIADENDVRVTKLAQSVAKCLAIIAPDLAQQNISFAKQLDVLDFYEQHTSGLIRQPKGKAKGKGKSKTLKTVPTSVEADADTALE